MPPTQRHVPAELQAPFLLLARTSCKPFVPATTFQVPGLQVHTLEAKDIWLRDFMPVRTGPDRFVWFRYEPDYLRNRSAYRTPKAMLQPQLPWLREREADGRCQHSALNVDGGNVVGRSGRYLMVEKVLRENEGMTEPVVSQLEEALHGEVILLPQQGGDPLGHADGAVRWLDDTTVLMSDFRRVDSGYDQILLATLRERGLAVERFPYGEVADSGQGSDEQIPTATGCYLNFLEVAGHLFLPQFGLAEDREALAEASRLYPRHRLVPVPCRRLSREGGVLNCMTWEVKGASI